MDKPLLFTDNKAIFIDRIIYIDFAEAMPVNEQRRVKVHLADHTTIIIVDSNAINMLVNAFIPKQFAHNYLPSIHVARN